MRHAFDMYGICRVGLSIAVDILCRKSCAESQKLMEVKERSGFAQSFCKSHFCDPMSPTPSWHELTRILVQLQRALGCPSCNGCQSSQNPRSTWIAIVPENLSQSVHPNHLLCFCERTLGLPRHYTFSDTRMGGLDASNLRIGTRIAYQVYRLGFKPN